MSGKSPLDLVKLGMAIERLWLLASRLNIDIHPLTTINLFHWIYKMGGPSAISGLSSREQKRLINSFEFYEQAFPEINFNSNETGHFLFRMGKGPVVYGYTLRRYLRS